MKIDEVYHHDHRAYWSEVFGVAYMGRLTVLIQFSPSSIRSTSHHLGHTPNQSESYNPKPYTQTKKRQPNLSFWYRYKAQGLLSLKSYVDLHAGLVNLTFPTIVQPVPLVVYHFRKTKQNKPKNKLTNKQKT